MPFTCAIQHVTLSLTVLYMPTRHKCYFSSVFCTLAVLLLNYFILYVSRSEIGLIFKSNFHDAKIYSSNESIHFFCPVNNTNMSFPCLCATEETDGIFKEELIISNVDRRIFRNLKCVVTFFEVGRLGNVIGQYATLYTLAKLNRRPAFMTPGMAADLKPYFKVTIPVLSERLYERIPWKNYGIYDRMNESYTKFEQMFLKLSGYASSYSFLHQFKDEIRNEFTLRDKIQDEAQAFLRNLTVNKTSVTFVGVHVRRGDYVNLMAHDYHGVLAEKQYFIEATNYFRSRYHNVLFVVVSNDMKWCKENIYNDKNDVYFVENNKSDPITDFAILMNCNHSIITVGTYGFFSAFLAGGDTVYLTNYTMPDSVWNTLFHWDTAYPPRWHPIAADLTPLMSKILDD